MVWTIVHTTSGKQYQCISCKEIYGKKQAATYTAKSAIKTGRIQKPGVGSGNNQPSYTDHPRFVSGKGFFQKERGIIRAERRYCERCGADLKYITRGYWCVHHRDHNRLNNTRDNYELLCKRCHVNEHKEETKITRWGI